MPQLNPGLLQTCLKWKGRRNQTGTEFACNCHVQFIFHKDKKVFASAAILFIVFC